MNTNDATYSRFGLVRDMMETPQIIEAFDADQAIYTAAEMARYGRLLITGEGSSRLFPAKHALMHSRQLGYATALHTEAGRQAQEYQLKDWVVLAISNSGKTSEVIKLFTDLTGQGHQRLYSLTAFADSKLESLATKGYVLSCGPESAVAATKSVVEQALFCQALVAHAAGRSVMKSGNLTLLSGAVLEALTMEIDPEIVDRVARAPTIYFAGRNDGVAEELTLKTNEITRKRSDYLEGTYAVHGVEEVMDKDDVVIWIDPYEDAEEKFGQVLCDGVGLSVIAIANRQTRFQTIQTRPCRELDAYISMAAGWNLLVEVGMKLGIDLDKPERARKVGNEFEG